LLSIKVAAKMIAVKEGIGAMILYCGDLMFTTKLMVGILTLSSIGVMLINEMAYAYAGYGQNGG